MPRWTPAEKKLHKQADRIAAASEAVHVAGWTRTEVRRTLHIPEPAIDADPLAGWFDVPAWEPWTAADAADRFLRTLQRLNRTD